MPPSPTAKTANADVETKRIPFTDADSERAELVMTIGPLTNQKRRELED